MFISKSRPVFLGILISLALFAACSDKPGETSTALTSEGGLLRFVPADTPYLMASPGDVPDDVMDKMEPQLDTALNAYHRIIRALAENAFAEAREEGKDVSSFEKLLPVIDELGTLMSVEGLRKAGIDRESDLAIYGTGLLPVFRLSLSDGSLLEAAIARLEEQAEQEMSVATIDGHDYRYAGDDEGRIIVGIFDNDLVITLVPAVLSDEQLKQVLGLTLPAENIAASGALQEIASTHGFKDYMIGLMDIEQMVATFLDEQSGINAELLTLMDYDTAELSDVCKAEIRSTAGIAPRLVMGYTDLTVSRMSSKAVIELREDIAAGVATLTGPVPGLGADQGGLISFGMSMDLLAAREFYSKRLDTLETTPYECELFADVQNGVEAGREVLNQPVPPIVYGFKGFLAVVEEIQGMNIASGQPPTSVDMRLLVAVDNAEGLLAMGAMFSPEIAGMNLEPDGEPVKLDLPQVAATGQVVHIAMSDKALGLSVGDGMQEGLAEMLNVAAQDPSPFMTMDMNAGRYYSLIGDAIAADPGDLQQMPEVRAAIEEMTDSIGEIMDRVAFDIRFTERGIEMESDVLLKD